MSNVGAAMAAEKEELLPDQSVMTWPDPEHGDVKKIWSRRNSDEVADARRSFEQLTNKGFRAFNVRGDSERGSAMQSFDPDAERMILIPPMVGG